MSSTRWANQKTMKVIVKKPIEKLRSAKNCTKAMRLEATLLLAFAGSPSRQEIRQILRDHFFPRSSLSKLHPTLRTRVVVTVLPCDAIVSVTIGARPSSLLFSFPPVLFFGLSFCARLGAVIGPNGLPVPTSSRFFSGGNL